MNLKPKTALPIPPELPSVLGPTAQLAAEGQRALSDAELEKIAGGYDKDRGVSDPDLHDALPYAPSGYEPATGDFREPDQVNQAIIDQLDGAAEDLYDLTRAYVRDSGQLLDQPDPLPDQPDQVDGPDQPDHDTDEPDE
jgi:hypothetical protein